MKYNVIQGDTFCLKVIVEIGIELIDKVYFSSTQLNIEEELIEINENENTYWLLKLSSETTNGFKRGVSTFDITTILKDGSTKTVVHNGNLTVYSKGNPINGN